MKRYNITTCRVYQSNGQEKKSWPQVGSMTFFPASDRGPEGYKIELNMFSGTQFFVFEQKPQDALQSPRTDAEPRATIDVDSRAVRTAGNSVARTPAIKAGGSDSIDYPTEEINPDDIPF